MPTRGVSEKESTGQEPSGVVRLDEVVCDVFLDSRELFTVKRKTKHALVLLSPYPEGSRLQFGRLVLFWNA